MPPDAGRRLLRVELLQRHGVRRQDAVSPAAAKAATEADLWKDPNDYFYAKFPEALLLDKGRPPNTCYGAFAVDCGEPRYRQFLLEQARRHLERLPDSAGICIDRLDWLNRYNLRGDDGTSWVDGRPARSLFLSWRAMMAQLGPLMHDAGKVIFVNNLRMRLELLRQVDGIYCEYRRRAGHQRQRPVGHPQAHADLDARRKLAEARPGRLLPAAPAPGRVSHRALSGQPPLHHALAVCRPAVSRLRPVVGRAARPEVGARGRTRSRRPAAPPK